jgi:hypothetical protein
MIRPVGSSSGASGLVPKSTGGEGVRRGYASRFVKNHFDNFMDNPKVQAFDRFMTEHGEKVETGFEVGSGGLVLGGAFLQKRRKSKANRLQR